jgi:hypothetical protein
MQRKTMEQDSSPRRTFAGTEEYMKSMTIMSSQYDRKANSATNF